MTGPEPDAPDAPTPSGAGAPAGRVVLVGTPIGNLDDLSPRAQAALAAADVVAAEDTRHTGRLLARLGLAAELVSCHDHNEAQRAPVLARRAAHGAVVALVTDAGTPGIADPGYAVVRAALAEGVAVEAVPGPAAFLQALIVSGLPTDRFAFEGFLPRKPSARRARLGHLADEPRTLVWYASPHRAAAELADAVEALGGERPAVVARELTKRFEEVRRGALATLAEELVAQPPRGELTVVVGGAPTSPPDDAERSLADAVDAVEERVAAGASTRDAVATEARARGLRRRTLYEAVLAHR